MSSVPPKAEAPPPSPMRVENPDNQSVGIELRESQGQIRVMKMKRAAPADAVRPTRAEINLDALRRNASVLRQTAGSAKVWAVLKADAYGHGAPAVARTLERSGVDGFCVALLEEGIELREAGITKSILVMGGYYGRAYDEMIERKLVPVIYSQDHLEGFAQALSRRGLTGPLAVHLKVDTGMARLGVRAAELPAFCEALDRYPQIAVRGLMTHLANADAASEDSMREQAMRFDEATALLAKHGVRPEVRHAANSAALLRRDCLLDAVRPGVAVFGVSPSDAAKNTDLQLAMRVRTEVTDLRWINVGEAVGYGSTFKATRRTRVATIAMGYADGLSRGLSNRGAALLRGKRAPYVGTVSMDLAMIDVTDHEGASVTDEVVVLGTQDGKLGRDTITADELALHAGTISWEILTHISRRVPRFYLEP
jgi:alanine racemase